MICYKHNDGNACDGKCQMTHVCRVVGCEEKHPMISHPGYKA